MFFEVFHRDSGSLFLIIQYIAIIFLFVGNHLNPSDLPFHIHPLLSGFNSLDRHTSHFSQFSLCNLFCRPIPSLQVGYLSSIFSCDCFTSKQFLLTRSRSNSCSKAPQFNSSSSTHVGLPDPFHCTKHWRWILKKTGLPSESHIHHLPDFKLIVI